MKKIILFCLVCFVLLIVIFFVGLEIWAHDSNCFEDNSFEVKENTGYEELASQLVGRGIISGNYSWYYYLWSRGLSGETKAGEHVFTDGCLSVAEVADELTTPVSKKEVKVTLIEGWTKEEMAEELEEQGVVSAKDFLAEITNQNVKEGYLFPDTYRFYPDSSASEVVRRLNDNFYAKTTNLVGDSDTIIIASIVQNEVRSVEDMKIVAGIFINRLNLGKALESDATINYITGKNALRPSLNDLASVSPYNTYKNTGLPPTAIGNPGLDALEAVVDYEDTDYLYFLTTPEGETVFSKTYEEHLENINKFLE